MSRANDSTDSTRFLEAIRLTMNRKFAAAIGAAFLIPLCSTSAAAEPVLLTEAKRALGENIPEVAMHKLQALLATKDLSAADRLSATLLLGQALKNEELYDDALSVIQPAIDSGEPAAILLRANILAGAGHWDEALALYREMGARSDASAKAGEAECLHALGRTAEAIMVVDPMVRNNVGGTAMRLRLAGFNVDLQRLDRARELLAGTAPTTAEEVKWKSYVDARLLLAQDQPAPALILFEEILTAADHVPESLFFAATFGAAEARVKLYGYAEAHEVLENFIWKHPESAYLEIAFRRLDEMYAEEENPSESELHKWSQKPETRRAALAFFYVAKMQVRRQSWPKAIISLDVFIHRFPTHPLLAQAYLLQEETLRSTGRLAEAVQALDAALRLSHDTDLRAEIELRAGLDHYQQGERVLAAQLFESAAKRTPRLQQVATFDAALAWLNQPNFDRFQDEYRVFTSRNPEDPLRSDLVLERGLVEARNGDPRAEESLKRFLREFPSHAREAEARLALAELAYVSASRIGKTLIGTAAADSLAFAGQQRAFQAAWHQANEYLQVANTSPQTAETQAHSQYLAIFLADSEQPRDEEKVISLAREFLREYRESPLSAEVRMKLAQIYFRRGDFANSETQFATLANEQMKEPYQESAPGPYAETALFLAGKSAMQLINAGAVDRAFGFFERVIKRNGKLKLYARQEQAILQHNLGHETEAVALYDVILSADPPADPELRQAALCAKGDSLRAMGASDSAKLQEAIGVFDHLANLSDALPQWRNQALYKKAKTLEQLGRNDEALDTYYDVLQRTATHGDREYFWYYKAGFDAAHVFEEQEQWKPAIGIYEKMAKLNGPRTPEAQARVRRLRLEHFIWE